MERKIFDELSFRTYLNVEFNVENVLHRNLIIFTVTIKVVVKELVFICIEWLQVQFHILHKNVKSCTIKAYSFVQGIFSLIWNELNDCAKYFFINIDAACNLKWHEIHVFITYEINVQYNKCLNKINLQFLLLLQQLKNKFSRNLCTLKKTLSYQDIWYFDIRDWYVYTL